MAPTGERGRGKGKAAPGKKRVSAQNSGVSAAGMPEGRRFQAGADERRNPGGRPSTKWIREYLAGAADGKKDVSWREAYMKALCLTAVDRKHRDHVKAALGLAAYDFGKPIQAVELTGKDGGPVESISESLEGMTSGERRKRIAELLAKAAGVAPDASAAPAADDDNEPV